MNACVGVRKKEMCYKLTKADLVVVRSFSDLDFESHLPRSAAPICIFYNGLMPTMEKGHVLSLSRWGIWFAVGGADTKFNSNDSRGLFLFALMLECFFCHKGLFLLCDTSNSNAKVGTEKAMVSHADLFAYSHMLTHSRRISAEETRPTILHAIWLTELGVWRLRPIAHNADGLWELTGAAAVFGIVHVASRTVPDPRSILRTRTELSLWRVMP